MSAVQSRLRGNTALNTESAGQARLSFIIVSLAFLTWGLLPVYWKQFSHIHPLGITSYRIFWSWIFVAAALTVTKQWDKAARIIHDGRCTLLLFTCGILIAANWGLYIFAITTGYIMESSLGYYINPLVNALFGAIFFGERLRALQKAAILFAIAGVSYMIFEYGRIPFYAISLAVTFAVYGAVHKLVKVDVLEGMFYEISILVIPALAILIYLNHSHGLSFFQESLSVKALLALAGPLTTIPLMGFAFGVQRLTLTTVGVIQYISPTATFLLGVFYFREPMTVKFFVVFCLIWTGILMYLADGLIRTRSSYGEL